MLFVHSADDAFGSDRVLLSVVETALSLDIRVRVLLPDDQSEGWLTRQLEALGVAVQKAPLAPARRRYLRPRTLPAYFLMLARAVRFLRATTSTPGPGLVYVNTSAIIAAATLPRRRRMIWHVHELVTSPPPLAWLVRVLPMWAGDDVIANSDAVAGNLRRAPCRRARLHRIYNGVPARDSFPAACLPGPPLCGFAGRLSHWKGYEVFVEAAGRVAADHPAVRFYVAGTPPSGEEWRMDALRRRLDELAISDRTDVLGMHDEMAMLFDRTHIVAVPSRSPEPFGLVTIEAMRSGCAVVATDHGGSKEIIDHATNGLLVAPDDVEALAGALRRLLIDIPLRRDLGTRAQQEVTERFSEERFRTEMERLWQAAT